MKSATGSREPLVVRLSIWLCRLYPASLRRPSVLGETTAWVRDAARETEGRPVRQMVLVGWLLADIVSCRRSAAPDPRKRGVVRGRSAPGGWLDGLRQDLRYGVRSLRHSPSFVFVSVAVLALGIGANATIFTLVDRLFLEPPPHVVEPDRLVRINKAAGNRPFGALAYPDFVYYRENTKTLESVYAYDPDGFAVTMGLDGARDSVTGWFVTDNYFDVLGAKPVLGRSFLEEENRTPGTHPVAVLSHALWQRSFAGDEGVIGEQVMLNGHNFDIVGVAPVGFRGASPIETPPDLWVPVMAQPLLAPLDQNFGLERVPGMTWTWLYGVGRLRPGVSLDQARADLSLLAQNLEARFPEWNEGWGATVTSHYRFQPPDRSGLLQVTQLLFVVVLLLLAIASANIAILLLARGSARQRETGVRLALGAARGRVVRQLVTENLLLAALGGAAGFVVAWFAARLAVRFMPMTFAVDMTPRPNVLLFALGLASLVAIAAGFVPALQAAGRDVNQSLNGSCAVSGESWTRAGLVVIQVALSVVLVTGSVLFSRSLQSARSVDLGFQIDHQLVVGLNLRNHGYDEVRGRRFVAQSLERLRALPGVVSASTSLMVPFRGRALTSVEPEGTLVEEGSEDDISSGFNVVATDYFETLDLPLVLGRGFLAEDSETSTQVVVVNQEFAERFWPGEVPLGKSVVFDEDRGAATVVGVAMNATYYNLGEDPELQIYVPARQFYWPSASFFVRTSGEPMALAEQVRSVLLDVDSDIAITRVLTLGDAFDGEIGKYRTAAGLVSLFGLMALLLASVGLYSVLSYLVVQRTREIGIRVALGATHTRVASLVVGRGLRLAVVGIALGVAIALLVVGSVTTFLFGIEPLDLATWTLVPLVLLLVAWMASLVPARRASRVDPVAAIRAE